MLSNCATTIPLVACACAQYSPAMLKWVYAHCATAVHLQQVRPLNLVKQLALLPLSQLVSLEHSSPCVRSTLVVLQEKTLLVVCHALLNSLKLVHHVVLLAWRAPQELCASAKTKARVFPSTSSTIKVKSTWCFCPPVAASCQELKMAAM